ncbi:MAG: exodeoxyribonuclease I [Gammaproteobacteria bacterium]|nr:exodeoxyribonuclease I [Gammaproteobacteria bacterium]
MTKSIYWYDYETFGADPRRDRAAQFAGIRTDENLNIIGESLMLYCQPADDFLPDPGACLITGITPQLVLAKGVHEAEFIKRIHREFSEPGTCVAGYNSIRFDDELTRQLLYRNFYDPYEREWKHGNSRWDIIDMLRLCAATRPEGIQWPRKEDGTVSFRLDQLTVANGIEHGAAHDALADVIATIAMAKLVRNAQPKLYDYVYQLRDKRRVQAEIDLVTRKPLLHVSMMYPAQLGCLALVMPICVHPNNPNGVIVVDLRDDPAQWLSLDSAQIRERVYTPRTGLEEGKQRVPLKTVHINKCPIITSPAVLTPAMAADYAIDLDLCRQHWQLLVDHPGLTQLISNVFAEEPKTQETDPDFMIYSAGFFGDSDRSLMQTVRASSPRDLGRLDLPFRDRRLATMLLRYRARNYRDSLSAEELQQWRSYCRARLQDPQAVQQYSLAMQGGRSTADAAGQAMLDALESWVKDLHLGASAPT